MCLGEGPQSVSLVGPTVTLRCSTNVVDLVGVATRAGDKRAGDQEEEGELVPHYKDSPGHVDLSPPFNSFEAQIRLLQRSVDQLAQTQQTGHADLVSSFAVYCTTRGIFWIVKETCNDASAGSNSWAELIARWEVLQCALWLAIDKNLLATLCLSSIGSAESMVLRCLPWLIGWRQSGCLLHLSWTFLSSMCTESRIGLLMP